MSTYSSLLHHKQCSLASVPPIYNMRTLIILGFFFILFLYKLPSLDIFSPLISRIIIIIIVIFTIIIIIRY